MSSSGIIPRYNQNHSDQFESIKNIQSHDPDLLKENPQANPSTDNQQNSQLMAIEHGGN